MCLGSTASRSIAATIASATGQRGSKSGACGDSLKGIRGYFGEIAHTIITGDKGDYTSLRCLFALFSPSRSFGMGSMSSIKRDVKKKLLPRPEAEKMFVS